MFSSFGALDEELCGGLCVSKLSIVGVVCGRVTGAVVVVVVGVVVRMSRVSAARVRTRIASSAICRFVKCLLASITSLDRH